MNMKGIVCIAIAGVLSTSVVQSQESLQKLYPVNFSQVNITDEFWSGRMHTVATSTLNACILYTETKTGRIRNFEKAAAHSGKHEGIYFDDSDVYKALEAMAYSLKNNPDPAIEKKADEWIAKIAAAQLPDGYLNTYYELTGINNRWTDMEKHEDYCAGHLIEAAIAYHNTTGKRQLLDVAIRFVNHIDSVFRKSNRHWVSGHQEIELALMRLYHHTNERKYLELAQWYLDQRGKGYGKGVIWDEWKDPSYCQDAVPVKDQKEITGHAVRAMYMYTGAADVAAVTNDADYIKAMKTIWEDVVYRNMYITGGIGAEGKNEGFGEDYDLPNESAYCETCASVGMVFWNQRMNMLTGEAKYIDVLERSLYNGALDGLSLSGDRFFYGNPLASTGNYQRREWFGTACCPSNIARLIASLGNYIYSSSENATWINLYIGSDVKLPVKKEFFAVSMQTGYPWKGNTTLTITAAPKKPYQLRLRVPGWLKEPTPGGLYYYSDKKENPLFEVRVNGKPVLFKEEQGYAVVDRAWKKGDLVEIITPMDVRRIASRTELKQNTGRIAIQYGPMVYCVEGADNQQQAMNFIVPDRSDFSVQYEPGLLGGINTITLPAKLLVISADGQGVDLVNKPVKAIPFFVWNNRGAGEMQVWLPTAFRELKVNQ
ncbi:glycoside hydrolase family 127 protein [Flavihumibacter profundi]|uniref:glycoside hydrolase family 127 protein n=1 Tax=Flavihumibacter profundi TaxID=2716883 RepID=UPI001CC366DC|nr:beta-L-arabinofuranosidase domain-containing protein [Flavihumibacter profundi]MBZ5857486.1 glycoside hydrolase family 127 protein [Flavihumibacter profundi]